MSSKVLSGEEYAGLAVAIVVHAGLAALLVLHPGPAPLIAPPERISVTLSEDVGPTSTSPEPQAAPAPASAPEIAPDPVPEPLPVTRPEQVAAPSLPRPFPRASQAPAARSRPVQAPAARPPAANRISNDFLKGVPGAQASGTSRSAPAAAIGPAVQSALSGAISRQLKPHWAAPQGADAEKLITVLAWSLNRDGSLAGAPRVVRQDGITDANRAQAARHAEQAMRAVQLAEPFDLPDEYYTAWQRVSSFRFDRRLSQ